MLKKLRKRLRKYLVSRQERHHERQQALSKIDRLRKIAKRKKRATKKLTRLIAAVKKNIAQIELQTITAADFEPSMCPAGVPSTNLSERVRTMIAIGHIKFHMVTTATSNGGHSVGSYHFRDPCMAVDQWHSSVSTMIAYQRYLYNRFGASWFNELFGPDGFYVKNGVRFSGHFPDHDDHTHGPGA